MSLRDVRNHVAGLSLTDGDLDSDGITTQIARLRKLIDEAAALDPTVAQWLSDEHFRGSSLLTAAKINKRKWGSQTATGEPLSRATIIRRFNEWVPEFVGRIDEYEARPETATVKPWLESLALFRADPIRNRG